LGIPAELDSSASAGRQPTGRPADMSESRLVQFRPFS